MAAQKASSNHTTDNGLSSHSVGGGSSRSYHHSSGLAAETWTGTGMLQPPQRQVNIPTDRSKGTHVAVNQDSFTALINRNGNISGELRGISSVGRSRSSSLDVNLDEDNSSQANGNGGTGNGNNDARRNV